MPMLGRVGGTYPLRFREVEDLFGYSVSDAGLPDGFLDEARSSLHQVGWRVVEQGRKVYFLPQSLSKVGGAEAVVERLRAERIFAAGDSLLDLEVMELAGKTTLFAACRLSDMKMGQLVSFELAADQAKFERLFTPD